MYFVHTRYVTSRLHKCLSAWSGVAYQNKIKRVFFFFLSPMPPMPWEFLKLLKHSPISDIFISLSRAQLNLAVIAANNEFIIAFQTCFLEIRIGNVDNADNGLEVYITNKQTLRIVQNTYSKHVIDIVVSKTKINDKYLTRENSFARISAGRLDNYVF